MLFFISLHKSSLLDFVFNDAKGSFYFIYGGCVCVCVYSLHRLAYGPLDVFFIYLFSPSLGMYYL